MRIKARTSRLLMGSLSTALLLTLGCTADGSPNKGDTAQLFKTVDENMKPVDMKDLIKDKPLVLVVGSAS